MRPYRSRWSIPWQLVAIVTAIVVGAMPNLVYAQPAQGYSGEDLFKGLLLGQGPVADLFPEVWNDVKEFREQAIPPEEFEKAQLAMSDYADAMIETIAAEDPGFFDAFAAEIQSGDHLRVESAVYDGAEKLVDVIAKDLGVAPEDLKPFDPQGLFPIIVVVVLAAAVAVLSLAVLATQLAAAVWAVTVVAIAHFVAAIRTQVGVRRNFTPAVSSLPAEVWIDWIAVRLAD